MLLFIRFIATKKFQKQTEEIRKHERLSGVPIVAGFERYCDYKF